MSGIINPALPGAGVAAPALGVHAPRGTLGVVTATQPQPEAKPLTQINRGPAVLAFTGIVALVCIVMIVQLGLSIAFAGRVLPGVAVANRQFGGVTRAQAAQAVASLANQERVSFAADGKKYNVVPKEVGAQINTQVTVSDAYQPGHHAGFSFLPLELCQSLNGQPHSLHYDIDETRLAAFIAKVVAASGSQPTDATVVITNGTAIAQPAVSGHEVSSQALKEAIAKQLEQPQSPPPRLSSTMQPARIQVPDLKPAIAAAQQIISTPVSITYNGRSFSPTPGQIGTWVTFNKSPPNQPAGYTARLDAGAIAVYLQDLAKQINVSPVTQKVNVQNGVSTVFQEGKNGVALDVPTLANQLAGLTPGQPVTLPAPTVPVPFLTQYNNSIALPYDQYIEVNLSQQHLWVYQNHQVVFDSPVTSGATGAGFPTATGLFSIQAKETNRHLIGYQYGPQYNYDVFVQYWMPFYLGFGLHDASWRSSFGGSDYYYGGSHGCVNLPTGAAAWIFNWASVGTPVWVHT